ncbi:uncharacterized protein PV09_08478 [Verruconis gallopava]|uniref:ribonuclease H n=1 Tax=Verruconis gallopava TaxID=253628 RepID=A0A0D2A010_9PEZI|nr:uncharacterized protein PV09_08478 [Verruconis gallopava]KIV99967.1 hypothetical protein PV09_08478 [Verruconis gallopava]
MSAPSTTSSAKRKRNSEMKFYAVKAGHKPGIYHTWADCKEQITGYKGAIYKSFVSLTDAEAYIKGDDTVGSPNSTPKKYYAIQCGRVPGVYTDWPSAQKQIVGWIRPKHKSFATRAEAEAFVAEGNKLADPVSVFPLETSASPTAGEESQEATTTAAGSGVGATDGSDSAPPTKKARTTKPKAAVQAPAGPGFDYLSPDAEDGFDNRIIMDPETGLLRYKTPAEQSAMKLMPKTEHHGEMLHIWTDGACMGNGKNGSIGGVGVYFGQHDPRNVSEPLVGRQTNNRAELTALKRALNIAPLNRPVTIHTDSSYAINCVTKWYINWRKRDWRNAQGKPVENRDLIEEILDLVDVRHQCGFITQFDWVRGHAGHVENEAADRLAVEGAMENKRKGASEGNGGPESAVAEDEFGEDVFADAQEELGTVWK